MHLSTQQTSHDPIAAMVNPPTSSWPAEVQLMLSDHVTVFLSVAEATQLVALITGALSAIEVAA